MELKLKAVGLFVEDMATAPKTYPWGLRSCYVADPEGNLIEIATWESPNN